MCIFVDPDLQYSPHVLIYNILAPVPRNLAMFRLMQFSVGQKSLRNYFRSGGGKPYSCSECSKSFVCASKLEEHTKIHIEENPYSCSEYPKSSTRNRSLKCHMMRKHTGERPFGCSECTESFSKLSQLKSHQKAHTNDKHRKAHSNHKQYSVLKLFKEHGRVGGSRMEEAENLPSRYQQPPILI